VENLELGERLESSFPSVPSPTLPSFPLSSHTLPFPSLPCPLLSLPLEVGPLNPARGTGGAHFKSFYSVSILPRLFISLQAYLVERYCVTVPPCPDIIWGNGVRQKIFGVTAFPAFPLDYTTVSISLPL